MLERCVREIKFQKVEIRNKEKLLAVINQFNIQGQKNRLKILNNRKNERLLNIFKVREQIRLNEEC